MQLARRKEKNKRTPRTWCHKAQTVVSFVAAAVVVVAVVTVAAIAVAVDACWVWVRVVSYEGRGDRCERSIFRRLGT